ncbi:MAG: Clp protease N-terminal domain-containing protein [Armatimonadota bacterium]
MQDRWTEMASSSVLRAQEMAKRSGNSLVTPEHLLLGIVYEGDNVACLVLDRIGVNIDQVRAALEQLHIDKDDAVVGDMELSPLAKRTIDLAYKEVKRLHNNYVGTEHLLLGILEVRRTPASTILTTMGADLSKIRNEVRSLQNPEAPVNVTRPRNTISTILCSQLLHAVDALALSITECPEEIWDAHDHMPPVWQQAYHAVYRLSYWVHDLSQPFEVPECHTEEAVAMVEGSTPPISQVDVSHYLAQVRAQSIAYLETLALIDLMIERSINGKVMTTADLIIDQIGHLRYYVGRIHEIVRAQTGVILEIPEIDEI